MAENLEGPVLSLVTKKIRGLKKKLTRVQQIEEGLKEGKNINSEQEERLAGKANLVAVLDEYEKLIPLLVDAVKEERASVPVPDPPAPPTPEPKAPEPPAAEPEEPEKAEEETKEDKTGDEKDTTAKEEKEVEANLDEETAVNEKERLHLLINLLYFAQVFDMRPQTHYQTHIHLQQMERSACVSYDYSPVPGHHALGPPDLDLIASLGKQITSRPQGIPISHKDALDNCVTLAQKWMGKSDEKLPDLPMSYKQLGQRMDRILASAYFTQTPVFQQVNEHTARESQAVAEAAAAQRAQMAQFEAQMGGPPPPVSMPMGQGMPMDMEAPAAAFYAQQMDMGAENGYYPPIPSGYGQQPGVAPPGRMWPPGQPVPPAPQFAAAEPTEAPNSAANGAPPADATPSAAGDAKIKSEENGNGSLGVAAGQAGVTGAPAQVAPPANGAASLKQQHPSQPQPAGGLPPVAQQQPAPAQQVPPTAVPTQGGPAIGSSGSMAAPGQTGGPPKVSLKDGTNQGARGPHQGRGKGGKSGGGGMKGGRDGDRGNYNRSYRGNGDREGGGKYGGGKYGGRGNRDNRDRHNGPPHNHQNQTNHQVNGAMGGPPPMSRTNPV
mmetsp:Transcript_6623/g.7611  ORF Transcript_6623/g.7611 Transcript_6623/m.7611 type:complete len:607 (+) Transcript_6623:223-2043(+)|eukprot:CAMPEP_0197845144 /NCGR_PEP_ID=MMETSP1438-20131217/2092_1 /TAXON_ID=1461541 /ORGANISM="Pterosperma sp., Strain CCMP1384" /LENGTH=606 /DNA_ID=CAMNT_0043456283 /DNA_START=219 /DNA_END=2039 /DNA_ORIENTATION=+